MLYITVPKNSQFKQCEIKVNREKKIRDCFVIQEGDNQKIIDIQGLVHLYLQHRESKKPHKTGMQGIIIYHKSPPNDNKIYLKYHPVRNATETSTNVSLITGKNEKKYDPAEHTSSASGSRWVQKSFLSSEKAAKQREKDQEEKANRRHEGDSPSPT